MSLPTRALTRAVPASFDRATVQRPQAGPPIDVARARTQHAAYVAALRAIGLAVEELAPDDALPDCCFIEDTCVLTEHVAVLTVPGAPSRRPELEAVRARLPGDRPLEAMRLPATLDGGDVMRLGRRVFVGRSARTNDEGVTALEGALAPFGYELVVVPLGEVLHLKCVCAPLGPDRLLLAEGSLDPACFAGLEVVTIPAAEAYAANVVAIGRKVIMPDGFPETRRILASHGYEPIVLDTSEIRKADGSLTCLSLLF